MYLADGEVAFFGKREEAMQYFESIGLHCPSFYNMAGTFGFGFDETRFCYSYLGN